MDFIPICHFQELEIPKKKEILEHRTSNTSLMMRNTSLFENTTRNKSYFKSLNLSTCVNVTRKYLSDTTYVRCKTIFRLCGVPGKKCELRNSIG